LPLQKSNERFDSEKRMMDSEAADAKHRNRTVSAQARAALTGFDRWRERHRDAGLTAILVMQVAIMFVIGPMTGAKLLNSQFVEALRVGMATTAVLIVNRYRPVGIAAALVFVISVLTSTYVKSGEAGQIVPLVNNGITLIFDIAVAWIVAHAAFDAGRINFHRIMGAVILYLYVGLIFAGLLRMEATLVPGSFGGLPLGVKPSLSEFLYFSLGQLTTVGSAGIAPIHPFARSLSTLESVIGQLYPATFIARLVTLHGSVLEDRRNKR
jgi:Ion channel